jgi:acyl-ACP thioesterase
VVRATDIDPFDHVNNAATWAIVEEVLAERPVPAPFRAELEHRTPIGPDAEVVVDVQATPAGIALWVRDVASGTLFATGRVLPLPG